MLLLQGERGYNGAPGVPGFRGDPGRDGTPGINGQKGYKVFIPYDLNLFQVGTAQDCHRTN